MNRTCSAVASEERARHRLGSAALCYGRVWFPLWSRALGIRHHRSADEGGVAFVPHFPPHYKVASVSVGGKYPGTMGGRGRGVLGVPPAYCFCTPGIARLEGGGMVGKGPGYGPKPPPFCFRTPGLLALDSALFTTDSLHKTTTPRPSHRPQLGTDRDNAHYKDTDPHHCPRARRATSPSDCRGADF